MKWLIILSGMFAHADQIFHCPTQPERTEVIFFGDQMYVQRGFESGYWLAPSSEGVYDIGSFQIERNLDQVTRMQIPDLNTECFKDFDR